MDYTNANRSGKISLLLIDIDKRFYDFTLMPTDQVRFHLFNKISYDLT